MSFQEFVDRTAPAGEGARRFDNSEQILPDHPLPHSPEQTREVADKAREIAVEIGARFDSEYAALGERISGILAQMDSYWNAPAPWGTLPTPPPLALFHQWFAELQQMRGMCRRYEADAERLVKAGVPQFKTYLQQAIVDTDKAIETLKKTNTSTMSSSPANYGAPPGPMPGYGFAPPPTAMTPPWLMPPMGPGMMGPGMMGPGMMAPPFYPDPTGGFTPPGPYGGGAAPFPPFPSAPPSGPPAGGPAPAAPPGGEPWRDEFKANEQRMKEDRARRDAEHDRFIKQIRS